MRRMDNATKEINEIKDWSCDYHIFKTAAFCIVKWNFCFEINTTLRTTWWVTLYTHPTIGHIFIYNGIHSFGSKILLQVSLKLLLQSISAMVYGSAAVDHQTFRRLKCHLLQKLLPSGWVNLNNLSVPKLEKWADILSCQGCQESVQFRRISSQSHTPPSVRPILTLTPAALECSVQLSRRRHRAPYLNSLPLHRATRWFTWNETSLSCVGNKTYLTDWSTV